MAVYTVSINFLENLGDDEKSYLSCILFCFSNPAHQAKLAVDRKMVILSKYKEIVNNADVIKTWLDLLSYAPSSKNLEKVDVDLDGIEDLETLSVELCSKTNGAKNLIVYSLGSLHKQVDEASCIEHNGTRIRVLDKDQASNMLNTPPPVVNISQSQIAGHDIVDSQNNQANG